MGALRFFLAFIGFLALYAAADYLGGLIPAWVGYAALLTVIAVLIAVLVKLFKEIK